MLSLLVLLLVACPRPGEVTVFGGDSGVVAGRCAPTVDVRTFCVIDGDTIDVGDCSDDADRVRLLGLDTPETTTSECYAEEAKAYLEFLLRDAEALRLEFDATCTDSYGRTLAYASILYDVDDTASDPVFINEEMIRLGYALVCDIPGLTDNILYFDWFKSLEAEAQAQSAGLWGACESPTTLGECSDE
ncbi:MAG: thermonuclease family protein [Deltaproteobacteria bacterium]|nr:thermonuclease family protein [Deltaproteobacteria bacterium]MBK9647264.1 thermonuclease family protein [Deltaproteobacteria bacterium]